MFQIPKTGRGVRALMATLTVAWVLFVLLADSGWSAVAATLPMVPASLLRGYLWQPLTAMLLQPAGWIGGIALQIFILWFAVSPVEARLGTRRLLTAFFAAGVLGNLATAALTLAASAALDAPPRLLNADAAYLGSGSAVLGVWVAGIATLRGEVLHTALLGRVKAEHLAIGLVSLGVLLSIPGGATHPVCELTAGAFGWWFGQRRPAVARPTAGPKPKAMPRFEVLEGGNENPGRSARGWRPRSGADEQWH